MESKQTKFKLILLFFGTLIISIGLLAGRAISQAPFYQGKTITLIQGTAPDGASDMMVKAALPYLKKVYR